MAVSCRGDPIGPHNATTSSGVRLAVASNVESTDFVGAIRGLAASLDLIIFAATDTCILPIAGF